MCAVDDGGLLVMEFNIFLFLYVYSYFLLYLRTSMKSHNKRPGDLPAGSARKRRKMSESSSQPKQKKQEGEAMVSEDGSDDESSSSGWSSEVIEPAIKTMTFRAKRGTRMKELMKGKLKTDMFWSRYQGYFGGGLDEPEDEDDQEDYEASSSGRDEFDSDFDLTDSYVGKRGRKKGSKAKKKRKVAAKNEQTKEGTKGRRGRKKKVPSEEDSQEKKQSCQQQKIEQISTSEFALKMEGNLEQIRKRKMEIVSDQQGIQDIESRQSAKSKDKNSLQLKSTQSPVKQVPHHSSVPPSPSKIQ